MFSFFLLSLCPLLIRFSSCTLPYPNSKEKVDPRPFSRVWDTFVYTGRTYTLLSPPGVGLLHVNHALFVPRFVPGVVRLYSMGNE
jgi:hypothetical protein